MSVEDYQAIVKAQQYTNDSLREALVAAMAKLYVSNRLIRKIVEILGEHYRE